VLSITELAKAPVPNRPEPYSCPEPMRHSMPHYNILRAATDAEFIVVDFCREQGAEAGA